MTTYTYSPLDPTRREIRVLKIHPGLISDDIHISLVHTCLPKKRINHEPEHPDSHFFIDGEGLVESNKEATYTALSYVWGSTADQLPVIVESAPAGHNVILVTQNLHSALRHLRDETRSRLMWIDALCINQGDIEERGSQVSIMAEIYKLTQGVIVWLGPERDDSTYAIEQLRSLGAMADDVDYTTFTFYPPDAGRQCLDKAWNLLGGKRELLAICQLFQSPWFERLWVRQEVRLRPQRMCVMCGFQLLGWNHLKNAIFSLYRGELPNMISLSRRLDLTYSLIDVGKHYVNYGQLRSLLRDLRWEDSRDVIYAVQSLLPPHERSIGISFDYSKTVSEVFEDVASRLIRRGGRLNWLSSCELSPRVTSRLPSWVPDWAQPSHIEPFFNVWHASAWISPQARLLGDGVLGTASIYVATIDEVRPLSIENDVEEDTDVAGSEIYYSTIRAIRSLKSTQSVGSAYDVIDAYSEAVYAGSFSHRWRSLKYVVPKAEVCRQVLEAIWVESDEWMAERWHTLLNSQSRHALDLAQMYCTGRSFIKTAEGYVGLAPTNAQIGDILYVILGCHEPMLLRPLNDNPSSLQVVGPCYVPGVMFGEKIHGPFPSHYNPVCHSEPDVDSFISGHQRAIWNSKDDSLKTDPVEILREMGIEPARYQRYPHILEVSRDTLVAAGINIEDIRLI